MAKVNTKLSTVVDEFRKLDLIFKTGSGLDVVERGYARKLVHAISSQNEVMECEALKGLGDLYLHKAQTNTDDKVENFQKACSMYTELLRYYTGVEEKQVVQHRIKYAEKCTKLVHDQDIVKARATNSGNTILAVSMTLHEMKGYGVIPLIEGYTNALVKGIVEGNKRLEIESIKSIGDLYLEKGREGKEKAALAKSAGLYRAALDRCEDSDDRETLRHRIKYAEKVEQTARKKAKKRAETKPLRNKKCGTESLLASSPITYDEELREGCRALQTGDLDTAERHFAAALKAVHLKDPKAGEHWKETKPLCKLSDVYVKKGKKSKDGGDFTKAAALSNAALVRAKMEDREEIKQTTLKITQSFVNHVLNTTKPVPIDDVEKHKSMLTDCRRFVEQEIKRIEQQIDPYSLDDNDPKIREVEKKRVEANKALFDTIVHKRRTFITGLVDECMEEMGPPPCKYAMIGLGSHATGLVTPYSDLEFAILIERDTENSVKYFHNLTHYLHLKVINLGETILPAMAIKSLNDFESDDKPNNWFYDSVTPRGFSFDGAMPHACKTPLGRATLLNNLGAVWSNLGDYRKAVRYHGQALQMRRSIYGKGITHPDIASSLHNLGTAWSNLGDYRKAVSYHEQALQMRRSIYGKGVTHPDVASSLNNLGAAWSDLGDYRKSVSYYEQTLQMSRSIYGKSIAHPDIASSINNLGNAWGNLGDHRKAVSYHEQALQMKRRIHGEGNAHPYIASSLNNLGTAWDNLGDYRKAVSYHEQALQMMQSVYSKGIAHPHIALSLNNLGAAWGKLGDYRKAVSYYEQTLQMQRSIYGEGNAHSDIASSLNSLCVAYGLLGDYRKAISYYEESKRVKQILEETNRP
ncbi:PREDICTED: uncharacterized protein LOC109471382 [Branchiostoma belcheri]|uniref:Uncharacterized protein LOC109471382 n=1 Tax=Branchiostoma belcheri TaxID=7741 RepID=A0A6P4YAX6_BRABE|nr:PREDICTED: uncharacterized protein LOC109471382 [Branchiostoma belcheri]